ncbi:MAG TPA: SLC13 family permease, partial [Phycicoccus sp.]
MTTTLLVLVGAVLAFVTNRIPLGVVAIGVSLALWATGILDLGQALAGFGDPTVLFIASLFVVAEALDSTGVTAWAGQQLIARGGTSRTPLLVLVCLLVALLTALISVNGAVAALLPVVVVVAARAGLPPSQMLMPLAFSAHAGSMLALTGTPVNIIVSEAAVDAGARPLGFVEFSLAGLPLLTGTLLVIVLAGRRLLPHRAPESLPQDLGDLTDALRAPYRLGEDAELVGARRGVAEVLVRPRSPLIGTHLFPGMATPSGDLVVLAVSRSGAPLEGPDETLRAGDTLLLSGSWDKLSEHTSDASEVLVVDPPEALRRAVPLGPGARRAAVILAGMVVLLATGAVPAAVAGMLAAVAVILSGVLTSAQAYRSISWTTVVLVGGMIPLSTAFITTGTADAIARRLLDVVGTASPHLALLAVCVLTMALGQLISNTATVLIVAPIAGVGATDLGVSPLPFMMALAVSGAAAFLTPVATPANTM